MRSPLLLALSFGAALTASGRAQELPSPDIERRLRQALWPEVLIGPDGMPEPGYHVSTMRGNPTQRLYVTIESDLPSFPRVRIYRAAAFRCFDCGEPPVSVVTRDSLVMTVISVSDLENVLPLAQPAPAFGDSTQFSGVVLELLRATCLIGCGARVISSKKDLDDFGRKLADAHAQGKDWKVEAPKTYLDTSNRGMSEEFYVATSDGVYLLYINQYAGARYSLSAKLIVYTMLMP